MAEGIVFDIQRFSLHDGPGIRTTVFLKGCSLRCFWCHNPEGLRLAPETQYDPALCLGDGDCAQVCPTGAHVFDERGHVFDRAACDACGQCVEVCAAQALTLTGRRMTAEAAAREALLDRAFYARSGGGVTLSGGDPLVQRAFTAELLRLIKAEGVSTALETAANCPWEHLAALLPDVNLVMLDLKHMDAAAHRAATGVSNDLILANARRLAEVGQPLILRVPVVPGVNDDEANIATTARFVRELINIGRARGHYREVAPELELLPYHKLAGDKYRRLGLSQPATEIEPPSRERMAVLAEAARGAGIETRSR
jgi:pyruvate formate lyase activating enzyme